MEEDNVNQRNHEARRREDASDTVPILSVRTLEEDRRAADRRSAERRRQGRRLFEDQPSEHQLQAVSDQLLDTLELERAFVARSLQNSVADHLLSVKFALEGAQVLAKQGNTERSDGLLEDAIATVRDALSEVRELSTTLRPSILDELGAASAISWLCRQFVQDCPEIRFDCYIDVTDSQIPRQLNTVLFRCVQILLGSLKAQSVAAEVELSLQIRNDTLALVFVDDLPSGQMGVPSVLADGAEYINLRKRVAASGGRVDVRVARRQSGTALRCSWPTEQASE